MMAMRIVCNNGTLEWYVITYATYIPNMISFTTPILDKDVVPLHLIHLESFFVEKDLWVVPNPSKIG